MSTNINNYDLFKLIESALSEDEEKYDSGPAENFVDDAKRGGYHVDPKNKKKKTLNQSKPKEEDFDIIEDDEDEDENKEDIEEKPEPTTVNLSDAISYEKLVDDLNMFRAAHSFSDKKISTELTDYFNSLSREEKQVLHILIKGLIHVTLMDVKGKSAKTPSDFNITITKTGATSNEKKKSLDKRIEVEKSGKKVDNNTPIKIGESRQNKSSILRALNANKF